MDFKETTNAMTGDISMSSMVLADDVVMRLLLLENRGKNSLSESVQFSAMVHWWRMLSDKFKKLFKRQSWSICAFRLFLAEILFRKIALGGSGSSFRILAKLSNKILLNIFF